MRVSRNTHKLLTCLLCLQFLASEKKFCRKSQSQSAATSSKHIDTWQMAALFFWEGRDNDNFTSETNQHFSKIDFDCYTYAFLIFKEQDVHCWGDEQI